MEFNFDDENNIKTSKTPSVKVLNDKGLLWISDECAKICEWKLNDNDITYVIETEKKQHLGTYHFRPANAHSSTLSYVKNRE